MQFDSHLRDNLWPVCCSHLHSSQRLKFFLTDRNRTHPATSHTRIPIPRAFPQAWTEYWSSCWRCVLGCRVRHLGSQVRQLVSFSLHLISKSTRISFNITLLITGVFALAAGGSPNYVALSSFAAVWSIGVGGNLPVDSAIFLGASPYGIEALSLNDVCRVPPKRSPVPPYRPLHMVGVRSAAGKLSMCDLRLRVSTY